MDASAMGAWGPGLGAVWCGVSDWVGKASSGVGGLSHLMDQPRHDPRTAMPWMAKLEGQRQQLLAGVPPHRRQPRGAAHGADGAFRAQLVDARGVVERARGDAPRGPALPAGEAGDGEGVLGPGAEGLQAAAAAAAATSTWWDGCLDVMGVG